MNKEKNLLTLVFKYEELGTEFLNEIQKVCEKYNIDLNNNSISQTPCVIPLQQGPNLEHAMLEIIENTDKEILPDNIAYSIFSENFDNVIVNNTVNVVNSIIPSIVSHIFEELLRKDYGNRLFLDEDDDSIEDNDEFKDHIISLSKKLAHDNLNQD